MKRLTLMICAAAATAATAQPRPPASAPGRAPLATPQRAPLPAPQPPVALTPAAAQTAAATTADDGYQLGPGDVIEVRVLGQQDFTTRGRIREDGAIALPFISDIRAQGRSVTEFARDVAGALDRGGYYTKPIVTAEIVSYASRYVTVLGAINQSGLQPVDREYKLSEILARAGGLRADSSDEIVIRTTDGKEKRLLFSNIALGRTDSDPVVRPGDRVFAPVAETYYIYGAINGPGAYPLKYDMTVRNALARGGGLSPSGSEKRVSVIRKGQKTRLSLEDKVQPGDTIVVGERLF